MHVSNFRPVKRIPDVLAIFDRIRKKIPARLLLIGDGPAVRRPSGWRARAASRTARPSSATLPRSRRSCRPRGSCCCRRTPSRSGWRRSRRWRAGCRSSAPPPAGCPRSSRTDATASSVRSATSTAMASAGARAAPDDPELWSRFSREARRRAETEFPDREDREALPRDLRTTLGSDPIRSPKSQIRNLKSKIPAVPPRVPRACRTPRARRCRREARELLAGSPRASSADSSYSRRVVVPKSTGSSADEGDAHARVEEPRAADAR